MKFDSLVQTATGFNEDEGKGYQAFKASQGEENEWKPRPLPMQAMDHAAGYFLAFGINAGTARMIVVSSWTFFEIALGNVVIRFLKDGGSHEVRVSLVGVGRWIRSLGRIDAALAFGPRSREFPPRTWPLEGEIAALSAEWKGRTNSLKGEARAMTALKQAALLSVTPAREGSSAETFGAPLRLDADEPVWI